jgi:hypothetical protein
MAKYFIYITNDDLNWVKGFEYYIDEWQLNYKVIQFNSVDYFLLKANEIEKDIEVIVLDWELRESERYISEAYFELERVFPRIPIIAFSEFEISSEHELSYFINKKANDNEAIFNSIITFAKFYRNDWIKKRIKTVVYFVQLLVPDKSNISLKQEKRFFDLNPIFARERAIKYFKENPNCFQIVLYGFEKESSCENDIFDLSCGGVTIYSDFLLDREILANLYAEYRLYKQNRLITLGFDQEILLSNLSQPFIILGGIANKKGQILLR